MNDFWGNEILVGDVLVYGALKGNSAGLREGVVTAIDEGGRIHIDRPEEDLYVRRQQDRRFAGHASRPLKWIKTILHYPSRTFKTTGTGESFHEERERQWLMYWDLPLYVRREVIAWRTN